MLATKYVHTAFVGGASKGIEPMRNRESFHLQVPALIYLAVVFACLAGVSRADGASLAERFVEASGRRGGMSIVIGLRSPRFGRHISEQGQFFVECLYESASDRERSRKRLWRSRRYGRLTANEWDGEHLPYADNLLNLVIIDNWEHLESLGLTVEEVGRVLAPLGTAIVGDSPAGGTRWLDNVRADGIAIGLQPGEVIEQDGTWLVLKKPWPDGIEEWTHYLHDCDGNPVAEDTKVGPPARYQWETGPTWLQNHGTDSSMMGLVTAQGRVFYLENKAPISTTGMHSMPDRWRLVARDAFNGTLLWEVPVKQFGWRQWKDRWYKYRPGDMPLRVDSRVVAVGDRVYTTLGYEAPVSQLDARTGKVLLHYEGTERAREILCCDGRVLVTVDNGDALKLMCVDAETGETLWQTEARYRGTRTEFLRGRQHWDEIDPVLNVATDGELICFIDGRAIVGMDFADGVELWRTEIKAEDGMIWGSQLQDYSGLWVGTLIVKGGMVYHASPDKLVALSAETGAQIWVREKHDLGWLWFQWKDVFVTGDLVWTWGPDAVRQKTYESTGKTRQFNWAPRYLNGYDPETGELTRQIELDGMFHAPHHHRCYRNKATSRYVIASRRGAEFVDLDGRDFRIDNWARGTCQYGIMPANGLLYVPPHASRSYGHDMLKGFNALAPASPETFERWEEEPRLTKGSAYRDATDVGSRVGDWPTYRYDVRRSGFSESDPPEEPNRAWTTNLRCSLSAPTGAVGRVFVAAVDEHHIVALDAETGRQLWAFGARGRVDSPPTYYMGKVIFGSADGYVYALRASDGELVWRFRAAPKTRLIGSHGQPESAWPVHGSVLVQNDVVYFAAGKSSHLDGGIYLYGLSAYSGDQIYEARLQGPERTLDDIVNNFDPPSGALADILQGDGNRVHMRHLTFTSSLSAKQEKGAKLRAMGGFLDGSYFKRAPWYLNNMSSWGRLISYDDDIAVFLRQYDSLRCLAPDNYFTPADVGYRLFCGTELDGKGETRWEQRIPVRVKAMVASPDVVATAGAPDEMPSNRPFAAFDGELGGVLNTFSAETGEKLSEQRLSAPPVFNGMMVMGGRLYVAQEDGRLVCFD